MKKIISLGLVLGLAPFLVSAYTSTFADIFVTISNLLGYVLPILITVAVIYFVWGVVQFISSADEEAKKNGRAKIINGLIGLFVIVAFWGIIGIVLKTFNVGNATGTLIVPCTPVYINGIQQPC